MGINTIIVNVIHSEIETFYEFNEWHLAIKEQFQHGKKPIAIGHLAASWGVWGRFGLELDTVGVMSISSMGLNNRGFNIVLGTVTKEEKCERVRIHNCVDVPSFLHAVPLIRQGQRYNRGIPGEVLFIWKVNAKVGRKGAESDFKVNSALRAPSRAVSKHCSLIVPV